MPVLVFKEKLAVVDIKHLFGGVPDLAVDAPPIEIDKIFSDTKGNTMSLGVGTNSVAQ